MKVQQKPIITSLQVSRGAYAGRSSELAPAFGRTTSRFFAEGEKHEANHWQDTILPTDDQPEERVQSGSFDRVPRNRGAMVALALLGIGLAAVVGFGVRALVQGGRAVETATVDFARLGVTLPSETPLPPPALPAVAVEAAAATEAAFPPGPAASNRPATSPDDGANAGPEDLQAAAAAPAPQKTSAATAVPADRKLRVEEGGQPSRSAEKSTRRPRFALKTARRPAITPALAEPTPGESSEKSGTPEPNLAAWPDDASDPIATGALAPPRFEQPSIASANTGAVAAENAPPALEKLPAPAGDKPADPAATAGSKHNPF